MAEKRKVTCLTLNEKRQILAEVDRKVKSKTEICKEYGLAKSTLSTFLKNREKIENVGQPKRKRQRVVKFEMVESAVFAWFKQA